MSLDLIRRLVRLEKRVDNLARPEIGPTPVFVPTAYTNTDFDGDSFSDVVAHTKIENTSWSTTIPSDAKGILIRIQAADSGSAGTTGLNFRIYSTSGAGLASARVDLDGVPNDSLVNQTVVVPCTDGDIWYRCDASGVDTLDVWLRVFGYWV
jgi:hypothetical protein